MYLKIAVCWNCTRTHDGELTIEASGGRLMRMVVPGMMTYSGGKAYGKPIIHLGPVGMSQDIGSFRELSVAYGERMGKLAAWLA